MLRIFEQRGVTRREILTAGATGLIGLTLPNLLRAAATHSGRARAVVNIHLDGGPPQHDLFDPKPMAPVEIRGEFSPLATTRPGLMLTELMPALARRAERFTVVRSLVGSAGRHDAFQCQSGFSSKDLEAIGGRPAMGCVVSKMYGTADDPAPPFVDMMLGRPLVRNSARPGFLGPSYQPFRPDLSKQFQRELETGMKGELARLGEEHSTSLSLDASLTVDRLHNRQSLLRGLDQLRREADGSGMMDAMDRFTRQATGILLSGEFAHALDLSHERPEIVERYRAPDAHPQGRSTTSEGPEAGLKLLMARRLIEAGVRCVSVSFSDFDTHSKNFPRMRSLGPIVDHAIAAFLDDLHERGMLDEVAIVAWGEFGRTPRIDAKTGGRHHWPRVGPALLAGAGMGEAGLIGATDRTGGEVEERPIHYQDVFATLFHKVGIDPHRTTVVDPQGRPRYLLESGEPIRELS